MISYTVDSLYPFQVREATKGDGKALEIPASCRKQLTVNVTGKLCGAFQIDEAFEAHLKFKTKLKFSSLEQGEYNVFVAQDWEMGAKRAFTGKPDPPQFILRPPAKAFKAMARIRGKSEFSLSKCVWDTKSILYKVSNSRPGKR